ncbi:uncharacterized protein LOC116348085, partial [Contarinia nasturtii]|uniref:uncharacterized protein LOC116348085 n=1 Tax=Contarinia nasturtii TaxID=265458 RepID=UPI0012D3E337
MAYAEPLKNKTGLEVTQAMERIIRKIIKQYRHINNLHSDQGSDVMKASIVERLIKTIKRRLYTQFSLQGNYKWLGILSHTIHDYNNSWHSTIRMKPVEVNAQNEQQLLDTVYNYKRLEPSTAAAEAIKKYQLRRRSAKFKVNDPVRLSKYRTVFDKSYLPQWSTEIFRIKKIQYNTDPITYLLKDYQEREIKGS